MRTKALLGLAAMAVGLSTSVAQNVYSLNVVGYVNVSLQANQLSFLSIPLIPSGGNFNITNSIALSDAQDGALLFTWAGTSWNATVPQWYAGAGWYPDMVVSNGIGFFLSSKAASTLTFVGDVPQGAIPYSAPTGFSTLANKVPVAANFPGADVGHDGDLLYTWGGTAWNSDTPQFYAGVGWYSADPTVTTNGPMVQPAAAVFYSATGTAQNWTRNFTVQ
jgi:hypothetical protein